MRAFESVMRVQGRGMCDPLCMLQALPHLIFDINRSCHIFSNVSEQPLESLVSDDAKERVSDWQRTVRTSVVICIDYTRANVRTSVYKHTFESI